MKKYLLLFLIAFALSCSDQVREIKPVGAENKIQVSEAMQHFQTETTKPQNSQENRSKLNRHSLTKNAVWANAFYQDLSIGSALVVPVKFDTDIYYKTGNDLTLPISALTYLMFYKDTKKEMHMEVITSLPKAEANDTIPQNFKGTVFVEKWNGDFITGFVFKGGSAYTSTAPSEISTQWALLAETCYTTNYYTCVSVGSVDYGCNYDYSETSCITVDTGGGGGGVGGSTGGGGGSGATVNDYLSVADNSTYIVPGLRANAIPNVKQFIQCIDPTKPAKVTIYVDQPVPGTRATYAGFDVGHTFIAITQQNGSSTVTRVLGFYPAVDLSANPAKTSAPSALGNDEGHSYDVSLPIQDVSAARLSNLINYIVNSSIDYNLNSYNCTNWAMGASHICGVNLPSTISCWAPIIQGCGNNPGDLGEDLQKMPGSVSSPNSYAPTNSGCPDQLQ